MEAIAISLLAKLWPFILAAVAALGWGYSQRRAGAKSERIRQSAREAHARDEAAEIDDAVAGRSPDKNRARLKKWGPKP